MARTSRSVGIAGIGGRRGRVKLPRKKIKTLLRDAGCGVGYFYPSGRGGCAFTFAIAAVATSSAGHLFNLRARELPGTARNLLDQRTFSLTNQESATPMPKSCQPKGPQNAGFELLLIEVAIRSRFLLPYPHFEKPK
jgi:hypothetical protein